MKTKNHLEKLQQLKFNDDTEMVHVKADEILCELLSELGYTEIVDAYNELEKWYA